MNLLMPCGPTKQTMEAISYIHKASQDLGLSKAAQKLFTSYYQRVCADMLANSAPYSMEVWKSEEERLRSDMGSANIITTYNPLPVRTLQEGQRQSIEAIAYSYEIDNGALRNFIAALPKVFQAQPPLPNAMPREL